MAPSGFKYVSYSFLHTQQCLLDTVIVVPTYVHVCYIVVQDRDIVFSLPFRTVEGPLHVSKVEDAPILWLQPILAWRSKVHPCHLSFKRALHLGKSSAQCEQCEAGLEAVATPLQLRLRQ